MADSRGWEDRAMSQLIGYFDYPGQVVPTYDPPMICLVCEQELTEPLKTISLMSAEEELPRSYFYRVHKVCYEAGVDGADQKAFTLIEAGRTGR